MHATEIYYKVLQGNISDPEKWVGNPLTNYQVPVPVPVPVPVQCEQFGIIYSNPLFPVPVAVQIPVLVHCRCERTISVTLLSLTSPH